MMVIVGGSGFFFGPYVGAMVAVLLPEWLRFAEGYYLILYAILVMLLLIYSPSGAAGNPRPLSAPARDARVASALRAAAGVGLPDEVVQ